MFAGDDWRTVDPAELALKTSVVEKDADAEALFWEVRVDDGEANELVFSHYVRVKVFTERGKESQSQEHSSTKRATGFMMISLSEVTGSQASGVESKGNYAEASPDGK